MKRFLRVSFFLYLEDEILDQDEIMDPAGIPRNSIGIPFCQRHYR